MRGSSLLECAGESHVNVGQQTASNREVLQKDIEHINSSVEQSYQGKDFTCCVLIKGL